MIRKMYKWELENDYSIAVGIYDEMILPYVTLSNNRLIISKGYAWDGCTPKRSILGLFIIGTPDGHVHYKTGKQLCYYPSLVHDALYQYELGTRKDADKLFYRMLKDVKFPLAWLYYRAIRLCGRRW